MEQRTSHNSWRTITAVVFGILFCASVLAYVGLIPTQLKSIPYYDSIGHFMLFGILAFSLDRALKGRRTRVMGMTLPIGSTVIAVYAIIDESLQYFSTVRTFNPSDLVCSLLGIVTFYTLGKLLNSRYCGNG
jgi:uncharacterized membrane protein YgdD (TMEM256/DUF423 family)